MNASFRKTYKDLLKIEIYLKNFQFNLLFTPDNVKKNTELLGDVFRPSYQQNFSWAWDLPSWFCLFEYLKDKIYNVNIPASLDDSVKRPTAKI